MSTAGAPPTDRSGRGARMRPAGWSHHWDAGAREHGGLASVDQSVPCLITKGSRRGACDQAVLTSGEAAWTDVKAAGVSGPSGKFARELG
jgi:hypothetical protein